MARIDTSGLVVAVAVAAKIEDEIDVVDPRGLPGERAELKVDVGTVAVAVGRNEIEGHYLPETHQGNPLFGTGEETGSEPVLGGASCQIRIADTAP